MILLKELDADDGEMTRTRKVRRRIIEAKYADLIEGLYSETDEIKTETEVTYEDGNKGTVSAILKLSDAEVVNQENSRL